MTTPESTLAATTGRWIVHRAFSNQRAVPWANGLGVTTQLISLEESTAIPFTPAPGIDAGWKLSVASLDQPATFSKLPGLARTFTPFGGEVVLVVNGVSNRIPPGTPFNFSGDDETVMTEVSNACRALNFMAEDGSVCIAFDSLASDSDIALILLEDAVQADGSRGELRTFDVLVPARPGVPGGEPRISLPRCAAIRLAEAP